MSKKRKFEELNEDSDSLFQVRSNAKRAKLDSSSDTTLQDLPMEVLESILIQVIVMEVKSMKLAKCVWKEKADLVINRLGTVNSHWSSMLTTNFFRNELHRTLDKTAEVTMRFEILHQFPGAPVTKITELHDEYYLLVHEQIFVLDRNNMAMKDRITVHQGILKDIVGCEVSNCVYGLAQVVTATEVYRITKEEHKFNIELLILNLNILTLSSISTSTNGNITIMEQPHGRNSALFRIFSADGNFLRRMKISRNITQLWLHQTAIQSENGHTLCITSSGGDNRELTEIDMSGNILRQYKPSSRLQTGIHFIDASQRLLVVESKEFILLDSEWNPIKIIAPTMDVGNLHYNWRRNEGLCEVNVGFNNRVLVGFRLAEN